MRRQQELTDYDKYCKYPKDSGFSVSTYGDKKMAWAPDKEAGFIPAEVLSTSGGVCVVRTEKGDEVKIKEDVICLMNPPKFDGVEDCAELSHLSEATVLHNLRKRYERDVIYTYSGLFCVVINPYKLLPIYTDNMVNIYRGKRRNEVSPHVFAVSDTAYRAMLNDRQNQSLLITGESGAGKTENTKKVIQYIANIAGRNQQNSQGPVLENQLVELNPMLEAFGNAKTNKNNNSSRFGKFIRLQFNNSGLVSGASLQVYLLEKSRVCHQGKGERSFHIFYQLLAGANNEEKTAFLLQAPEKFNYLNHSGAITVNGLNDVKEFEHTKVAMEVCGITKDEQATIFRIIAAILHLGNIAFAKGMGEGSAINEKQAVESAAKLLNVNPQQLEEALCKPRIKAANELVKTHLTVEKASYSRDALTKTIYQRLFLWVVKRANKILNQERANSFIGILDIAGFEIFEKNSFEQICINYTNEKLQQFFNHHMFKLEQEEYLKEKIDWTFIDFGMDSQAAIDLIDKRPHGILVLLDEECVVPKANDDTFLAKLNEHHERNPLFEKPRFSKNNFCFRHYAGVVEYEVDGWIEKNKDPLQDDLELAMKSSKDQFVVDLFGDEFVPKLDRAPSPSVGGKSPTPSATSEARKKGAQFVFVAAQHKEQLSALMTTLSSTAPHFIRCIIPNHRQRPNDIDAHIVLDQLRCNGVLEGIRISRKGFPNRVIYAEFLKRYYLIGTNIPRTAPDAKAQVQALMEQLKVDKEQYRLGLTKIFFRAGQLASIEEKREQKIGQIVLTIQAASRAFIARNQYRKLTSQSTAAKTIQRNLRAWLDFKDWPWWRLYIKAKPMIKRFNFEAELEAKGKALEDLDKKLKAEAAAKAKSEKDLEELQAEFARLKGSLDKERGTAEDLAAEKRKLESIKNDLTKQLEQLELDYEDEKTSRAELAALRKKLEDKTGELEEQLDDETRTKAELEQAKKQREAELEELKEKLNRENDERQRLERSKATLEKEINDLRELLDDDNDAISNLEKQKKNLTADLEELREKLDEKDKQAANLDKANKKFQSDLKDIQTRLDDESQGKDGANNQIKKLQGELAGLQQQFEDAQKNISALAAQKKKLEADLDEASDGSDGLVAAKGALERQKKQLESDLEEIREQLEEETNAKNAAEDASRKKDAEIADLKRQFVDAYEKIAKLEKDKKALEAQL